jgi:hypothetical protein
MEEAAKDTMPSIEYHLILKYFGDVFVEILGFPPKTCIYFSIDLVPRAPPVSKTPYKTCTIELKELQM